MYYQEFQPHPNLSQFVQCYWTVGTEAGILTTPEHGVIPGGYVDIIFNIADPVCLSDSGRLFADKARSFVVGPFDHFQRFRTKGQFTFLGVRFHPGKDPFFSNFRLGEARNQAVPLELVIEDKRLIRDDLRSLDICLARSSDVAQRIASVEQFLMKLLQPFPEPDQIVIEAIGLIEKSKGQISVEKLASALDISARQLERKFIQHVHLSPKIFCRITRFRQMKLLLEKNRECSTCQLAYACGYYDQTHLIREFRLFTGQTPVGYERARPVGFFLYEL